MKGSTFSSMFRTLAAAAILFAPMTVAYAQEVQPMGPADQQSPPPSALSPQQLENLVAPLALYPDPLLSQVLVAASYPLEVVEAGQWLQRNRDLTGTALTDAAREQNWDPSVQALVAFPDVLSRLNQDVRWTTDLGNAFLGQQADVMSAVQRLRARAQANGKLRTTQQQIVTMQTQDDQAAIAIQPADPQVIYVPSYDPGYIWGEPAWGAYPSLFYPTYGFGFGFGIPIGGFYGGWGGWGGWGWGPNWFGRSIYVNGGFFHHYGYRYGGGHGYRGGFGGNRAWNHDYSRSSRATGTAGYSRSYQSANSGFRSQAGQGYRGGGNQSFNRGSTNQSARNYQSPQRSTGSAQGYAGSSSQRYQGGAQRYSGSSQNNSASTQRYSAPAQQRYSAPAQQHYSAPAQQHFSAPAQHSFGGSSHFSGGGGGGSSHFSGGGGGGSRGGGGRR